MSSITNQLPGLTDANHLKTRGKSGIALHGFRLRSSGLASSVSPGKLADLQADAKIAAEVVGDLDSRMKQLGDLGRQANDNAKVAADALSRARQAYNKKVDEHDQVVAAFQNAGNGLKNAALALGRAEEERNGVASAHGSASAEYRTAKEARDKAGDTLAKADEAVKSTGDAVASAELALKKADEALKEGKKGIAATLARALAAARCERAKAAHANAKNAQADAKTVYDGAKSRFDKAANDLASAKAVLDTANNKFDSAKGAHEKAKSAYESAKKSYDAIKEDIVKARKEFDVAEAAYQAAAADVKAVEKAIDQLQQATLEICAVIGKDLGLEAVLVKEFRRDSSGTYTNDEMSFAEQSTRLLSSWAHAMQDGVALADPEAVNPVTRAEFTSKKDVGGKTVVTGVEAIVVQNLGSVAMFRNIFRKMMEEIVASATRRHT